MKIVELKKQEHSIKTGDNCPLIEPNVKEDCLFSENGEIIGFYIRNIADYSDKLVKLITLANAELLSDRVPKSLMERSDVWDKQKKLGISRAEAKKLSVTQYSAIIGSIPPKPHMRRPYPTRSSVHSVDTAKTFVKAMLLACKESEKLMKDIVPHIYEAQLKAIQENVPKEWRFGNLFTSSISNFNISAPFHVDRQNIKGCCNVIITKRKNSKGGCTTVPDYGATVDSCNNSMLVYPAWRNIHGVTPIIPTQEGGYRNSLVFYPLSGFGKK